MGLDAGLLDPKTLIMTKLSIFLAATLMSSSTLAQSDAGHSSPDTSRTTIAAIMSIEEASRSRAVSTRSGDWFYVASSEDRSQIFFIDRNTIKEEGDDHAAGWTESYRRTGEYEKAFVEVNCRGRRHIVRQLLQYEPTFKNLGASKWIATPPGTPMELLTRFICRPMSENGQLIDNPRRTAKAFFKRNP